MKVKGLSTGQAAKICSVTPDTILKWIRAGRLRATRTPGGHNRIDRADLEQLMRPNGASVKMADHHKTRAGSGPVVKFNDGRHFHYCWEFHGNGQLLNGCSQCAVFKLRAQRCYEVAAIGAEVGHNGVFCKNTCAECSYFKEVYGRDTNVLVVTNNGPLGEELTASAEGTPFELKVTECEYTTSAIVETFRPDFVVVDCGLGQEPSLAICNHLMEDPRIPFVRVILAAGQGDLPKECNKEVFAQLDRPFDFDDIGEVITATGHGFIGATLVRPRLASEESVESTESEAEVPLANNE